MTPEEARERFAVARVASLATADASARPHIVPIAFALAGERIYSAVDTKPKRTKMLRRLANVRENPLVAVLVDHWDEEEWSRLWWARADGRGRVLDADDPEASHAATLLLERYPLIEPAGDVLAIDVERWSGWEAAGGGSRP